MSEVQELLKPLIAEAKATDRWLHCHYQDLWFSPEQLEAANAQGRFLWGPVNWTLRDPQERVAILSRDVENARLALESFKAQL
jgi:hypothetical protein